MMKTAPHYPGPYLYKKIWHPMLDEYIGVTRICRHTGKRCTQFLIEDARPILRKLRKDLNVLEDIELARRVVNLLYSADDPWTPEEFQRHWVSEDKVMIMGVCGYNIKIADLSVTITKAEYETLLAMHGKEPPPEDPFQVENSRKWNMRQKIMWG